MLSLYGFFTGVWSWFALQFRKYIGPLQISMRFVEFAVVITALVAFYFEMDDRRGDRINRAWGQVAQASIKGSVSGVGNLGVVSALETLVNEGVSLTAVELNNAWLEGASLQNVVLDGASLHESTLLNSNITKASLRLSRLTEANVIAVRAREVNFLQTRLNGAVFVNVDLRNSVFLEADLEGAKFLNAALDGAHFKGALNISPNQFEQACLINPSIPPILPDGVNPPHKKCVTPEVWKMHDVDPFVALTLIKRRKEKFLNALYPTR